MYGQIDIFTRERIEGWAWDPARGNAAVQLTIYDNGVKLGTIRADVFREDLRQSGIGNGRHAFVCNFPEPLSPAISHTVAVKCEPGGWTLPGVEAHIPAEVSALQPLDGNLDACDRHIISGWARDSAAPDTPIALQVLDGNTVLTTVLANRYREDLKAAGVGDGGYAFEIRLPRELSPLERHVIRIRHADDGREIPGSPFVIERSDSFDSALEEAVIKAIDTLVPGDDEDRVLSFLMSQTERLLLRHGHIEGKLAARLGYRQDRRARGRGHSTFVDPGPRALVIDDHVPDVTRDAGSQAIMSHMRALRALGYSVSFIAAQDHPASKSSVEALGSSSITLCSAPYYPSVEDLLKWQRGGFDLIYLHRISNAQKYMALAQTYNPKARFIYSVADLHYLRVARQAKVEERPELLTESNRLQLAECLASLQAERVITHSHVEADLLRRAVPAARVEVVPWEIPICRLEQPILQRPGIAFIAGFRHRPNIDSAWFLLKHIMPIVWERDSSIILYLAGSHIPDWLLKLAGDRVEVLGAVDDLHTVFNRVRLTVAPLRFGAGIKGKVLNSFGAGIPCVMTPIAAEGLPLDSDLRGLIATTAQEFAEKVVALHGDAERLAHLSAACQSFVHLNYSDIATLTALKTAIERS